MAKPITIPNTFASATSAIPLSQLDQDFSTLANSTNDLATYSNYVADTGAADAFIANYPANTNTSSLTTGLRLQFKAANANTGASTLNVQVNGASIGTASIRLTDGSALPANTIIAGALVDVMYDGTNFQIMNDPSGGQEIISNLTLSGNLTVAGTSTFTGNVTGNVVNTTTSTITNLTSGNVTITGGSIDNISITNLTSLTVDGNTTLGDASGDTLTITGTTVTTPNGLNFDSNTLVIDATNNQVGIGTSSPASGNLLHVAGGALRVDAVSAGSGLGAINLGYVGGVAGIKIEGLRVGSNSDQNLLFYTSSTATGGSATERMRIDNIGNVGIGTSSPNRQLVVYGSSPYLALQNATTGTTSFDGFQIQAAGADAYVWNYENSFIAFGTNATERMRLDSSGNLGLGVTPYTSWATGLKAFQIGTTGALWNNGSNNTVLSHNAAFNNSDARYLFTEEASYYSQSDGKHIWYNAPSGTAGNAITFTQAMTLDASGNLLVGSTSVSSGTTGIQIGAGKQLILANGNNNLISNLDVPLIYATGSSGSFAFNGHLVLQPRGSSTGAVIVATGSGAGAMTERMRITSTGLVGIGTASPSYALQVETPTASGNTVGYFRQGSGATALINSTTDLVGFGNGATAGETRIFADGGSGFVTLRTNNTERMRITSGGDVLIGTTTSAGKSTISQTSAARAQAIIGNSNSQGTAQKLTVVRHYPVVSLGTKLIIPFVSQPSLNSTTTCKVWGHGARYNSSAPIAFEITFAVGHLTTLANLASWGGQGNYASIATNGMNVEITFTTAYTSATADGVYVTIEYMTNSVNASIDVANIAMN